MELNHESSTNRNVKKTQETHRITPVFRTDIEGLRGLAVAAVALFHAFPEAFPGGFIGVDLFFVISGYLITGILGRDLESNRFSLSQFYAHRARRLLPSLVLVLVLVWILGAVVLLPDEFSSLGSHLGYASVFVTNFKLWLETGYFDSAAETKPLLHLWSLGIEEQFYLIWPGILWLVWRRRHSAAAITLAIALASFSWNVYSVGRAPEAAFYLPGTRLWELLAGAWLATVSPQYGGSRKGWAELGFALIAVGFWRISSQASFPGFWALLPVMGTVLVLGATETWVHRALSNPVFGKLGRISYPFYLLHWPLLCFLRLVAGEEPTAAAKIIALLVAAILAAMTYRWVESPIRARLANPDFTQRRVHWLVASLILPLGLGLATTIGDGFPNRISGITEANKDRVAHAQTRIDPNCPTSRKFPEGVLWCLAPSDREGTYGIIGDSHAQAVFPALRRASKPGEGWIIYAIPGCPPVTRSRERIGTPGCYAPMTDAITTLAKLPHLKWIVLTVSNYTAQIKDERDPRLAAVHEGLENTIEEFRRSGKRVAILLDNPSITTFPEHCDQVRPIGRIGIQTQTECSISRKKLAENLRGYHALFELIQKKYPDLVLFDPTDRLCDPENCPVSKGGRHLYGYTDHLSDAGADLVAPALLESIRSAESRAK